MADKVEKLVKLQRLDRTPAQEARRQEYLERLRKSTTELSERIRQSEQLTAEDFAVRINATDF